MKTENLFHVSLWAVSLWALLLPLGVRAQEEVKDLTAKEQNVLAKRYLRPSRSVIYISDGSDVAKKIVTEMQQMEDEKFDKNQIATSSFSYEKEVKGSKGRKALGEAITAKLREERVGNQIMKCWFPNFNSELGMYSTDILSERGHYTATDDDVIRAKAAHRGIDTQLTSLGEQLIDRSYVVVYYVYSQNKKGKDEINILAYIYKLDFSPEVMQTFYSQHFTSKDGIDAMDFPIKFVYATGGFKFASTASKYVKSSTVSNNNQNYQEAAANARERVDVELASKLPDFAVRTPVVAMSPIRAKIGRKEGLRTGTRFDVVEQVLDPKDGSVKTVRRAAVRVGRHIADNRKVADGSLQDFTRFYRYAGFSHLEPGMTLLEHQDLGIGLSCAFTAKGVRTMAEYRVSDVLSYLPFAKGKTIPGLFLYATLALEENIVKSFGVRKEFNFSSPINASLNMGYAAGDKAYGVELGIQGGVYLHPSFNLFLLLDYTAWASVADGSNAESRLGYGIGARLSF